MAHQCGIYIKEYYLQTKLRDNYRVTLNFLALEPSEVDLSAFPLAASTAFLLGGVPFLGEVSNSKMLLLGTLGLGDAVLEGDLTVSILGVFSTLWGFDDLEMCETQCLMREEKSVSSVKDLCW